MATFVGRDAERSLLHTAIDTVRSGVGTAVVIEGEAGIGKTRLVEDCLIHAADRGVQVWSGSADELARDRPFGVLTEALEVTRSSPDRARAALAHVLLGEQAPGGGLRYRILDDLLELIERESLACPCVIALDDLHWADPSTLLALNHLLPRARTLPVLVIGVCRPRPRSRELAAVVSAIESGAGQLVALPPLAEAERATLVRNVLGAEPSARVRDLLAGAGGNPFYLLEVLAGLEMTGDTDRIPPSVHSVILRRLAEMSADAHATLRIASVLGGTFSLADLATVTGRPSAALLPVLTELVETGVVVETLHRFRFAHDLVREAVYDGIPGTARQDLHRDAGDRLARAGAPTEAVATQMALGARPGDSEAVAWLRSAAEQAQPSGPLVATELLERALKVAGPTSDDVTLSTDLVKALVWAGEHSRADDIAARALARLEVTGQTETATAGRLRLNRGQALLLRGSVPDAVAELDRASGLCSGGEAASAAALASAGALILGDLERATRLAEVGEVLAVRSAAADAECLALTVQGWSLDLRGRFVESRAFIEQAVQVKERVGQTTLPFGGAHGVLGVFLASGGYRAEATAVLDQGRRQAEAVGAVFDLPSFHAAMAMLHLWDGRWDDALAEIETSLNWWEEHGSTLGIAWPLGMRSYIHVHRGDLRAAREAVAAAEREVSSGRPQLGTAWLFHAGALLAEADGDVPAGANRLHTVWRLANGLGARSLAVEIGPDLVRLLVAADRQGDARQLVDELADLDSEDGFPLVRGAALRCAGVVASDAGLLLEAESVLAAGPRPVLAAFAASEAADALAQADRRDEAVSALHRATARFETCGATRDIAAADARLRALGVRRGRRGRRARPSTGWGSLTPTEERVIDLAAGGLTNREIGEQLFISRRTVETHLSHVFAKLGIASRVELAAEAARRTS